MSKERRIRTLQYLGMAALAMIALYYFNLLFNHQLQILDTAVTAILAPFGIALFISYLLAPMMNFIDKYNFTKKRFVSTISVLVIFVLLIALFAYFVGAIIVEQVEFMIASDFYGIREWLEGLIIENETVAGFYNDIVSRIDSNETPIWLNFVTVLRSTAGIITVLVLVPVFLFFLLQEKSNIFNGIVKTMPKKYQNDVEALGLRANTVIQKYFNGRFISMFIMSILFTVLFWGLGFSFQRAVFFGFLLGFLDIVPYIGAFVGIALPILYSLTLTYPGGADVDLLFGGWTWAALLIANTVLQFFQGNILQPYIMGREVNLHPLLVLSSFIFFGALFGIVGVILAIPITGIIKTVVRYYSEQKEAESPPVVEAAPKEKEAKPHPTK